MHPILLKLGPVTIYSYGVMVALGFALATYLIYVRASELPSFGVKGGQVVDLMILLLISGVAGARILYVLINCDYFVTHPFETVNLTKGGLIWYGAFFAAAIALLCFTKRKGLDFWQTVDLIAPYLALAQAFGRIGCFLNGCCYGRDGHPAQLYSAGMLFLIFAALRAWQDARRFAGEIFLGYCMLYSVKRFVAEFFRGDNPRIAAGLTMSQVLSVVLFAASAAVFINKASKWKKKYLNLK